MRYLINFIVMLRYCEASVEAKLWPLISEQSPLANSARNAVTA